MSSVANLAEISFYFYLEYMPIIVIYENMYKDNITIIDNLTSMSAYLKPDYQRIYCLMRNTGDMR